MEQTTEQATPRLTHCLRLIRYENENMTMTMEFLSIPRATLALNYLNTNSTTHTSPFSAIAELVDNAYDADADTLEINLVRDYNDYYLEFKDDGTGMSQEEVSKMILFGHSNKTSDKIGRYGNGMKSGGFHLGRELFMITKKDGINTCLLISHAFHADNKITDEVLCPCVSMDDRGNPVENRARKFPWILQTHEKELDIINQYAPLRGRTLQEMIGRIRDRSGTLIIIGRLKKTGDVGKQLEIVVNGNDIETKTEDGTLIERSLREYLSVLYLFPKMRIILIEEAVQPKKLCANWLGRYHAELSAEAFKHGHNKNVSDMVSARDRIKQQIDGFATDTQYRNESVQTIDQMKATRRHLNERTASLQEELDSCDKILKDLQNANRQKKFKVIMGCDVQNRENNGMHFYINNRLITWGHKSAIFRSSTTHTLGISLYVNVSYDVFSPTHNKQSFESQEDFKLLVKKCNAFLNIYQKQMEYQWIPDHLKQKWAYKLQPDADVWAEFWQKYGYNDATTANLPRSQLADEAKKTIVSCCGVWILCQSCKTWRRTPGNTPPGEYPYFRCSAINLQCCGSRSLPNRVRSDDEHTRRLPPQAPLPPVHVAPAIPVDRMASNINSEGRRLAERSVEETKRNVPKINKAPRPAIVGEVEDEDLQPVEALPMVPKNEQAHRANEIVEENQEVDELEEDADGEQENDEDEQEDDDERVNNQSVQKVRPQNVYAKKPATKVSRRRQHESSSDDSSGEEEGTTKKAKTNKASSSSQRLTSAVKPAVARPGIQDEQVSISKAHLDNYNQFLVWFNTTPISSGSRRVIDAAQLIKTRQGMIDREKRTVAAMSTRIDQVLDEFSKHSSITRIRIPSKTQNVTTLERINKVVTNIYAAKGRKAARK
ncbi:hypothetical protein GCK72_026188 [Caenorhabditis remanei]|uniref:Morc S5 domain-containing protein n=1 Tax=Caenorhabditis remanei TaxID=31234 RepID=A0A6A5G456_CAERE|nr:hypothetical protein GCK72_026188 [Caenorhabditis remanei]KAF1749720.1 hypothetical protein GCK72_026188 [Caenorhabditis remanei]